MATMTQEMERLAREISEARLSRRALLEAVRQEREERRRNILLQRKAFSLDRAGAREIFAFRGSKPSDGGASSGPREGTLGGLRALLETSKTQVATASPAEKIEPSEKNGGRRSAPRLKNWTPSKS